MPVGGHGIEPCSNAATYADNAPLPAQPLRETSAVKDKPRGSEALRHLAQGSPGKRKASLGKSRQVDAPVLAAGIGLHSKWQRMLFGTALHAL